MDRTPQKSKSLMSQKAGRRRWLQVLGFRGVSLDKTFTPVAGGSTRRERRVEHRQGCILDDGSSSFSFREKYLGGKTNIGHPCQGRW